MESEKLKNSLSKRIAIYCYSSLLVTILVVFFSASNRYSLVQNYNAIQQDSSQPNSVNITQADIEGVLTLKLKKEGNVSRLFSIKLFKKQFQQEIHKQLIKAVKYKFNF